MPRERLIPDDASERWALRGWLTDDCEHVTRAVLANRYSVKDALHFLIGSALGHAERAHMAPDMAHGLAVAMFWERLHDLEARREEAEARIKRRMKPLIDLRQRSNVLLAEAHGENGAAGFPLSEHEVKVIVVAEMQWAKLRLRGRRHVHY
jgi:hypothetical protein